MLASILYIISTHWLGLLIPGADMAMVTKNSLCLSKKAGLSTAAGLALGMGVSALIASLFLSRFIRTAPSLLEWVRVCGALYLLFLAYKCFRKSSAGETLDDVEACAQESLRKCFFEGFFGNLTNPKVAIFFIAIFSISVTELSSLLRYLLLGEILLATLAWFAFIAWALTHPKTQRYLRNIQGLQTKVARWSGFVFLLLALLLLYSALFHAA